MQLQVGGVPYKPPFLVIFVQFPSTEAEELPLLLCRQLQRYGAMTPLDFGVYSALSCLGRRKLSQSDDASHLCKTLRKDWKGTGAGLASTTTPQGKPNASLRKLQHFAAMLHFDRKSPIARCQMQHLQLNVWLSVVKAGIALICARATSIVGLTPSVLFQRT